jgi:hypothetical protein
MNANFATDNVSRMTTAQSVVVAVAARPSVASPFARLKPAEKFCVNADDSVRVAHRKIFPRDNSRDHRVAVPHKFVTRATATTRSDKHEVQLA